MDKPAFPFLRLPVELQVKVANNIGLSFDLKALHLTSKEVSDIATPRLYYKVDLRRKSLDHGVGESIGRMAITGKDLLSSS